MCLYCSPILQSLNKVKENICKIVLKNTSNLDLFPQMISYWWGLMALGLLSGTLFRLSMHHQIQEMRTWIVVCSLINLSLIFVDSWLTRWDSLELQEFIMCLALALIWIYLETYPNWVWEFLAWVSLYIYNQILYKHVLIQ